jgi:glycine/D-amino acid oxidase-like deaminating enzyme
MQRRDFLKTGGAAVAGLAAGAAIMRNSPGVLTGTLTRPGMRLGHALRDGRIVPGGPAAANRATEKIPILIVGGGVAGLSAAYFLSKAGMHDHLLLEMEQATGGNAAWGENAVTRYPWGAHYLPLPTRESSHVRHMLQDFGMLLDGVDTEAPAYDERYFVHAPDERVFDGSQWHEGIFYEDGLAQREKDERRRFGEVMGGYRSAYGADGRKAFAMPAELSSMDPKFRQLDSLTMAEWLDANGFKGARLLWYVNYCCRDDFGTGIEKISAWMGVHYFASRGGKGQHAEQGTYLTWPEGLGRLAAELAQRSGGRREHGFVNRLSDVSRGIRASVYFPESGEQREIEARTVIWAAPSHVARHAIGNDLIADRRMLEVESAPWVVANLALKDWPKYRPNAPFSWDNVIMRGQTLGYVVATHQDIVQATHGPTVLTCYDAWSQGGDFAANRRVLEKTDWCTLAGRFLDDLRPAHPDIDALASRMDIRIWGHAMASPGRGFLSHPARNLAKLDGKLLFAHTDAAGYSVFEEASWLGMRAAQKALRGA